VAELEAPKRYPVTPSSDPACEHIGEGPSRPVPAERVVRMPPEPRAPALIGQIETRRGVMSGKPCIAGTRITVETLQALARDGHSDHGILALYPYLDIEDVRAALAYQEPPRPAPRPRSRCKVRVLMPGEELAPDGTVTTPAAAAG